MQYSRKNDAQDYFTCNEYNGIRTIPEWTRSRKTQSRMSTYLVTEVFYT